jgi:hypothetical protein
MNTVALARAPRKASLSRALSLMGAIVVLCTIVLAAGTSSAHAFTYYCNKLVAAYSECDQTSGWRIMLDNTASYGGSPTISVCQKVIRQSDGQQVSRTCANGSTSVPSGALDYYSYYGYLLMGFVGNNSGATHTINGEAHDYRYPSLAAPTIPPSSLSIPSSIGSMRTADASDGSVTAFSASKMPVTLESTRRGLCVTVEIAGRACTQPIEAETGKLMGVSICDPGQPVDQVVVYGAVPNGVTAVEVKSTDGRTLSTSPVQSNVYRFSLSKGAAADTASLAWVGKRGSSALAEVIPSDLGCS